MIGKNFPVVVSHLHTHVPILSGYPLGEELGLFSFPYSCSSSLKSLAVIICCAPFWIELLLELNVFPCALTEALR